MNPAVSVIVPTYNRAALLERAICSVLAQTYRDFEVIIVDDASTDNTEEVVRREFGRGEPEVRYVKNEHRRERGFSRNRGIDMARGKYIACLDDDDAYLPEFLEVLVGYFEKDKDLGCVFSNFLIIRQDGSTQVGLDHLLRYKSFSHREWCLLGVVSPPSAAIFSKSAYDKIGGFREELNPIEDREFFSRIALFYPVTYADRITCHHYLHQGNYSTISSLERALLKEKIWESIRMHSALANFALRKQVSAYVCIDIAWSFLPDIARSRAYFGKALDSNRLLIFRSNTWALMLRLLMGQRLYSAFRQLRKGKQGQ